MNESTLVPREESEFNPFVSVEDAKISILQSDGDIKHFGGFIGRNLPFEEDSATTEQPAITPSKYTKTIRGVSVDVYDVLQAWGVSNPALQHLIKRRYNAGSVDTKTVRKTCKTSLIARFVLRSWNADGVVYRLDFHGWFDSW